MSLKSLLSERELVGGKTGSMIILNISSIILGKRSYIYWLGELKEGLTFASISQVLRS